MIGLRYQKLSAIGAIVGALAFTGVASAANVLCLGPGRGYDHGNLFQQVMTGNSMETVRAALMADGHSFSAGESFTPTNLSGQGVVFLGLFDPTEMLNGDEQIALLNYVRAGGALIYLGDNEQFATSNSSVAGMFGVTFSADPKAMVAMNVLQPMHPILNGPGGVIDTYDGSGNREGFLGGIDHLGPYAQAVLGTASRTVIAVIERGALQPGSGPVVFLADANGFMDSGLGRASVAENVGILRNVLAFVTNASGNCLSDLGCTDGLFCNGAETCVEGMCMSGAFPCAVGQGCNETTNTCGTCANNAQCDDGLFCNGTETCASGVCQSSGFPCANGEGCDERDGTCGLCGNDAECDDGVYCNGVETCVNGACTAGLFPCEGGLGCQEGPDTCGTCATDVECDDGVFCNGIEKCAGGVCEAGSFPCDNDLGCDEGQDMCAPCGPNATCDDGAYCNGIESCVNGECQASTPPCSGGEVCDESDDSCGPCTDDAQCDDGLFCNGAERCDVELGTCVAGDTPCQGLICQEDDDLCAKVSFAVVTVSEPSAADGASDLPESKLRFNNGETLFAEVWAQTSHVQGLGCMYADMVYGDAVCALEALAMDHSTMFSTGATGVVVPPDLVDEFGGCAEQAGVGMAPSWHRVGHVQLIGGENCDTEVCLAPSSSVNTNFSGSQIPADQIGYDCKTVTFADCLYDLDDDDFVGPGDLALFASCWLCCAGDECFEANQCAVSDFDCDVCVGPGDLSYFATGWLADCSEANAIVPPCQSPGGVELPPANETLMRTFNLDQPPRGWPTTRSDWYTKLRAKAAAQRVERSSAD